jgi:hypothetical protein
LFFLFQGWGKNKYKSGKAKERGEGSGMFQRMLLLFSWVMLVSSKDIPAMECRSVGSPSYRDSSKFNPELADFSKMKTLKTWVADQYHADEGLMKKIQKNVAMTIPQNAFSNHFMLPILNNEGDKRYFGKTFPTIAATELSFLQFVKQASKKGKIATLEIGASMGLVSWKVPFAFKQEEVHYANDLSHLMLDGPFEAVMRNRLKGANLKQAVVKLPENCLNLLSTHPDFEGKFHAIYVQNVEHFFNPLQHQQFITVIEKLLAEDGRAFLCSHSYVFGTDKNNPLFKLYLEQKKQGRTYPGFAKYVVDFIQAKESQAQLPHEISEAEIPEEDALCGKEELEVIDLGEASHEAVGKKSWVRVKQRVISNAFSPQIYRNAFASFPTLDVLETFFINKSGEQASQWGGDIGFAGVIVQKRALS